MLKRSTPSRHTTKRRRLAAEPLEARRLLAASLGWDGPGLGSAELIYTIRNAPDSLSQAEVNAAIETAFDAWANVVDITFTQVSQTGLRDSIDISFTNIDGAGSTLAQAYFPDDVNPARIAGDIQFDAAEVWEVGNSLGSRAFDLVWVAAHEIGHSLGLDHLAAAGSALQAFVSPNQSFAGLSESDVTEIRRLYAAADDAVTSETPVATTPTTATPDNDPVNEPSDTDEPDDTDNADDTGDTDDNRSRRRRWRRGFPGWRGDDRNAAEVPENRNLYDTPANQPTEETDGIGAEADDESADRTDAVENELDGGTPAENEPIDGEPGSSEPSDETEVPSADGEGETDSDQTDNDQTDDNPTAVDDTPTNPVDDGGLTDQQEDCHSHSHHRGRFGFGRDRFIGVAGERLFDRFDDNGDDELTADELPESVWQRLVDKDIDADADGSITREEIEAYAAARRAERFAEKDDNGDELLTADEVSSRFWAKISPADSDADGGVSLAELETWLEQRASESPAAPEPAPAEIQPASAALDRAFAQLGRNFGRGRR
jgi:hypothetical protein